jgi:hypothetical protein
MKADFKVAINAPFVAGPKRGKPRADKPRAAEPRSPPPRIAVLMALAIHMERLLREGQVKDQVELASLAGVTRARVTQVMNLLGLAPDIQEALLVQDSSGRISAGAAIERKLRSLTLEVEWCQQRRELNAIRQAKSFSP